MFLYKRKKLNTYIAKRNKKQAELDERLNTELDKLTESQLKLSKMVEERNNNGVKFTCGKMLVRRLADDDTCQVMDGYSNTIEDKIEEHRHEKSVEILICVLGKAKMIIEGEHNVLEVGDVITIPMNNLHSYTPMVENTRIIAVLIPAEEAFRRHEDEQDN